MHGLIENQGVYIFGSFRLDAGSRTLTRGGEPVALTRTVIDVLLYLVGRADQLVTKAELLDAVWAGRVVEEANIKQTIFSLRRALGPEGERRIKTVAGKGYRFDGPVEREFAPRLSGQGTTAPDRSQRRRRWRLIAVILILLGVAAAGGAAWWWRPTPPGGGGTLVLADFANTTGDPVFDRSLASLLRIDLTQSPYFSVLSERQAQETLAEMTRPKDTPMTAEIAQEVCVRNNGAALLQGAVVALGSHYMLTLAASDCATGRQLVADKQEAARREDVPSALDRLIGRVRQRLGESVRSVRRYDVPLVPAQTASLDALKAYSEGKWLAEHGRQSDAIPLYQHAAELDPQFAMAYAGLSIAYATLYDQPRSLEAIRSAYALRDVANEHDRFRIAVLYDQFGTRDYNAALRDLHMWTEIYPTDPIGWSNLANAEEYVGRHALAAADGRHALALKPGIEATYAVVMRAELGQGHYAAAKALGQAAIAAGLGGDAVHSDLLKVAVAQGDARDYAAQTTWTANNPSARMTPADEAEVAFQRGQVRQGMAIFDRLSADAAAQGEPNYLVSERARLLADFGLYSQAKALLARWRGPPDHEYLFSLAEVDDPQVARQALDAEMKRMPADSLLHELYAPEISAELALRRHAPAEALKALAPATRYEAHDVTVLYLIAAAWLAQGQGDRAMAAFQTLLDHRGWYPTSQIFPLAQLGLARAQRLAGQVEASRDTYRRLLTDWRDADSDLPVLKQARNELAGAK